MRVNYIDSGLEWIVESDAVYLLPQSYSGKFSAITIITQVYEKS